MIKDSPYFDLIIICILITLFSCSKSSDKNQLNKEETKQGLRTYQDTASGFAFDYPDTFEIRGTIPSPTIAGKNIEWYIEYESTEGFSELYEGYSFEEFAYEKCRNMRQADGPDGCRYCSEVIQVKEIQNNNELKAYELYFLEHSEFYPQEWTTEFDTAPFGPVYIVRLSKENELHRTLILSPIYGGVDDTPTPYESLEEIVATVRRINQKE
ncbi:MAG: hypothetical protein AB1765_02165 [Candidatus Hydrogenedentota bacterium]